MNRYFFLVGIRKIHRNALIYFYCERSGLMSSSATASKTHYEPY